MPIFATPWLSMRKAEKNKQCFLPVTGASMSIIVFSDLSRAAPSLMILSAAFSSSRPSRMKCCLRTSGLGLLVRESNTSAIVILFAGGNGTAERNNNELKSISWKDADICLGNFCCLFRQRGCKLGFNLGFQTRVWNPRPRDIILGEDGDWVNSRILARNPRACYPLSPIHFSRKPVEFIYEW